jgi:hypothetical protein
MGHRHAFACSEKTIGRRGLWAGFGYVTENRSRSFAAIDGIPYARLRAKSKQELQYIRW